MKVFKPVPIVRFVAKSREEAISHAMTAAVEMRRGYPPRPGSIGRAVLRKLLAKIRALREAEDWEAVYWASL